MSERPTTMSAPEVAAEMGITRQTLYSHIRQGWLKGEYDGYRWSFTSEQVEAYRKRLQAEREARLLERRAPGKRREEPEEGSELS